MLTIRLARIGKKKQPIYRLIINEKTKDTLGDFLENLGTYNPRTKETNLKTERIKHWLSKGAGTSDTVQNLLVNQGIIKDKKVKSWRPKKKKEEKKDSPAEAQKPDKKAEDKKTEEQSPAPAETKPEEKPANEAKEKKPTDKKTGEKPEDKKANDSGKVGEAQPRTEQSPESSDSSGSGRAQASSGAGEPKPKK
ncbi:30S ribosomal protein S16 [Candidatus Falkowbacteria bacterium]|nr:30S ribosomal protein S16 [Candidatus Falkowbacteria bacterium]